MMIQNSSGVVTHVSKIVQHTTSNKDRVKRLVKLQDFSYFPNRGEFVCDTDVIKKAANLI